MSKVIDVSKALQDEEFVKRLFGPKKKKSKKRI
jgi:hypothetical protein